VGTCRVFEQFSWLGAGSVKAALSRPAHQRVTQAVSLRAFFLEVDACAKSSGLKNRVRVPLPTISVSLPCFLVVECFRQRSELIDWGPNHGSARIPEDRS